MKRAVLGLMLAIFGERAIGADETWPQWRGPRRDGVVAGPLPTTLRGDALKELWSVPLAPSYSGPIVSKDSVFVTETRDRTSECVQALDRATGKSRWTTQWPGAMSVPFFAKANGDWIRSTPALDGDQLFVGGMRDLLVSLDTKTGAETWKLDFTQAFKTPLPSFGLVCSPLVVGAHVYVQAGAGFVKVEKATGKQVWRTLEDAGGMYHSAFSSPYLTKLGNRDQMLVQTRDILAGVDPEAGVVLWKRQIPAFRGMNILTPTVHENRVFTSTYGGKTWLFDVAPKDGAFAVEPLWENKLQGYMSTPVVVDGHVYLHLRNQRFACVDLKSGKEKWITSTLFGQYWSMVTDGKTILALDQAGVLYAIKVNPEKFELLDKRTLGNDSTWAHIAIAGDEIFVRALKSLTVFRWNKAG